MPHSIVFDIETGPLPESQLKEMMPEFEAPGNLKDPEKIKASIEAKRKSWIRDAALSPLTGEVLAIGLWINGTHVIISEPATEAMMLHEFWDAISSGGPLINRIVGFNILEFDLPFLMARSWKFSTIIPLEIRSGVTRRYWSDQVIDLRHIWQCGNRQAPGSLDTIAKHLGIGQKTGSGADFANLWKTDRPKAIEYLKNDLDLTAEIAKRFGVL